MLQEKPKSNGRIHMVSGVDFPNQSLEIWRWGYSPWFSNKAFLAVALWTQNQCTSEKPCSFACSYFWHRGGCIVTHRLQNQWFERHLNISSGMELIYYRQTKRNPFLVAGRHKTWRCWMTCFDQDKFYKGHVLCYWNVCPSLLAQLVYKSNNYGL